MLKVSRLAYAASTDRPELGFIEVSRGNLGGHGEAPMAFASDGHRAVVAHLNGELALGHLDLLNSVFIERTSKNMHQLGLAAGDSLNASVATKLAKAYNP